MSRLLPDDDASVLVGRIWDSQRQGPVVIGVHRGVVVDLSAAALTVSELMERDDVVRLIASAPRMNWSIDELDEERVTDGGDGSSRRHLLAPIDLQAIKACGVTFADSLIERLIEEEARGDKVRADEVRSSLVQELGDEVFDLEPGSDRALAVRRLLIEQGRWSQYLEVGIGPYPEVFTKGPVLSAVGSGQHIGIPAFSQWNNPEPELVLIVDSSGIPRGATLGNDVNLRDIEGRSALLLGMAKDNNGSTAIGPFVRLFDDQFTLDTIRHEQIELRVEGADGYVLEATSNMARISRPLESLVSAVHGPHHQYPDGFALFTGTLFAPTQDRHSPGSGFTHEIGDRVTISSPHLGTLTNIVGAAEDIPPWSFGITSLMRHLAGSGSGELQPAGAVGRATK